MKVKKKYSLQHFMSMILLSKMIITGEINGENSDFFDRG